MAGKVKLTDLMMEQLRYAERNHGRTFENEMAADPVNRAIREMTAMGLFVDGGPSQSGRWRELTPAGRAHLASRRND